MNTHVSVRKPANTHVSVRKPTITLTQFMQRRLFMQATGTSYARLDRCIQCGDIAIHLIDGRIKIDTLEALKALAIRYPWHSRFAQLIEQFERDNEVNKDLFA
jgi:hypothetical protein